MRNSEATHNYCKLLYLYYRQEEWLHPLLAGEMRSCFAMTEPAVASSDATNIQSSIVRDGDSYVINGHKWWISGMFTAMHLFCTTGNFRGRIMQENFSVCLSVCECFSEKLSLKLRIFCLCLELD